MHNNKPKSYKDMNTAERVAYMSDLQKFIVADKPVLAAALAEKKMDAESNAAFRRGTDIVRPWPFGQKFYESTRTLLPIRCVSRLLMLVDMVKKQVSVDTPAAPKAATSSAPAKTDGETKATQPQAPVLPSTRLHIDQVRYLLSDHTASRTDELSALYDKLKENSNKAKELGDRGASQSEVAPYSEAACAAQDEIADILKNVDEELARTCAYAMAHPDDDAVKQAATPFGSTDHFIAALTPYYEKMGKPAAPSAETSSPLAPSSPSETPAYDPQEYKRIWTYVNRKDVKHTEQRLQKMRECIDQAIAAQMPNIEAMEVLYNHECELILDEQKKKMSEEGPSLL